MSLEGAHVETQRTLLHVEATAATTLATVARDATRGQRNAVAGALALRRALRPAIALQRVTARQRGRLTLGNELDEAERLAKAAMPPAGQGPSAPTLADELAAHKAADNYAALWLTRAERADPSAADDATAYRLTAIAGAETGQAFGAEREAVLDDVATRRDWGGVPLLGKRWDARLDACKLCRALADIARPLGINYPGGWVPGARHPRCRCISAVILLPLFWRNAPQD